MRMNRMTICVWLCGVSLCGAAWGQLSGGFGGGGFDAGSDRERFEGVWRSEDDPVWHASRNAEKWITIQGTAEIRVPAQEIAVVLAVTGDAKTADVCQEVIATQIAAVRGQWKTLNIPDDKIVEDFIAVLPRYEWHREDRDGQPVRIQKLAGYRMQTNLHVSVKNEAEAKAAIHAAFQHGVTDIVTFNYWSPDLDQQKVKVRALALEAAKTKAELLLSVFDQRPPAINVEEKSAVFFPSSLYRTYQNVLEEDDLSYRSTNEIPRIRAYRPKTTFYQGLQAEADVRPSEMSLRPEIAVVATVRIYYLSPAPKRVEAAVDRDPFGG